MKKIFTTLFIVLMLLGVGVQNADADEYKYTIEVDGGLYGQVTNEKGNLVDNFTVTVDSHVLNDKGVYVSPRFNAANINVVVNNPKYAFLGFHVAGRVADELGDSSAQLPDTFNSVGDFEVNKDVILVATYGVKSRLVPYYVRYVDEAGNDLLPQDTLYGNTGDKPVVAYRYISGYIPNAYHFTGTIPAKDASPLTFTFKYSKINSGDDGSELEPIIIYTYPTRILPTVEKPGEEKDEGEEVEEVIEVVEPAPIIDVDPNPSDGQGDNNNGEEIETEEIGNILTPLVNWIKNTMEENPVLGVAAVIGLVILALGILFLLIFLILLLFKKRKKDDQEEEIQE